MLVNAELFITDHAVDENAGGYESSLDNDDDISDEEDADCNKVESDVCRMSIYLAKILKIHL